MTAGEKPEDDGAQQFAKAFRQEAGLDPAPADPLVPVQQVWWKRHIWVLGFVAAVVVSAVLVFGLYLRSGMMSNPVSGSNAPTTPVPTREYVQKMIDERVADAKRELVTRQQLTEKENKITELERRLTAAEEENRSQATKITALEAQARQIVQLQRDLDGLLTDLRATNQTVTTARDAANALKTRLDAMGQTPFTSQAEFAKVLDRITSAEGRIAGVIAAADRANSLAVVADGKAVAAQIEVAGLTRLIAETLPRVTALELARASIEARLLSMGGQVKALEARSAAPALPAQPSTQSSPSRPGKIDPDWFKKKL